MWTSRFLGRTEAHWRRDREQGGSSQRGSLSARESGGLPSQALLVGRRSWLQLLWLGLPPPLMAKDRSEKPAPTGSQVSLPALEVQALRGAFTAARCPKQNLFPSHRPSPTGEERDQHRNWCGFLPSRSQTVVSFLALTLQPRGRREDEG